MKTKNIKNNFSKACKILFLNILLGLILLTIYIHIKFSNISFEQLLYSLQTAEGTDSDVIFDGAFFVISRLMIINFLIFLILFLTRKYFKNEIVLKCLLWGKQIRFQLFPLSLKFRKILLILFIFVSLFYMLNSIGFIEYVFFSKDTKFFDKYYVSPNSVSIKAPDKKQNLIFIYVESLESSLFSHNNGGNFDESIIPNLENVALNNINFSSSDLLGGATMVNGTTWTIAGIVAQSAGIPLKLATSDGNIYWDYNGEYLPGAYTLGDVLKDNGYKNYFLLGSRSGFGGRSLYFSKHGNYEIFDYGYALSNGWIDEGYEVWWGYEDKKLYEFAKKELTKISKDNKPFNFTMLTADTHFTDGYLDESCPNLYEEKYLNVYHCADMMLAEFLEWLSEQSFYKNTSIVIVGDHLTMQDNFKNMLDYSGDRYIYNAFINSMVSTDNLKNRKFTSMDIYPTILASLGFEIEGNRLGVGTNLFSNRKTLAEEIGMEKFKKEISNKSNYYNNNIVKSESLMDK